jgi:hypothetical protein
MDVHRSQEASNPEQSSQWWILLKSRTSRITLLLLLLVSISIIPVILSIHPLPVKLPQNDRPSHRNQYQRAHTIDSDGKNNNTSIQYNLGRQGQRIIMPIRGTKSSSGKSRVPSTPKVGLSTIVTKKATKPTAAERSAVAEARKDQQLKDILETPRFDPIGDGNFSTSESSAGWVAGGAHDADWTTDDDDDNSDEGSATPAPIRRWETTLRKVDEAKTLDEKTFLSPQRKEGSDGKRAQLHTPIERNRLRGVQTRNTQSTPESLGKMKIDATFTKHGEILDSHIKDLHRMANPYTSAIGKIHFGSNDTRLFDAQPDEIDYSHLDAMEDTDDEDKIDCPPIIGRTKITNLHLDTKAVVNQDQSVESSGPSKSDRQAIEVGGGGDCMFYAVADQAVCDRTYALALRAATAKHLLDNKHDFDHRHMIVGDELKSVTVEEYAARVSTPGE